MRRLTAGFLFLICIASASPAFAESWAESFNHKFQQGAVNTLLGWSKLLTVPYEKDGRDPNAWWTMGRSIYEAGADTVLGVFNLVFSPTPLREVSYPNGGVLKS